MVKPQKTLFLAVSYTKKEADDARVQIGLLYMATILHNNGFPSMVYATNYPDPDAIISLIKEENVKIVGFYTNTENFCRSLHTAKLIKEQCPGVIILMGGPHATFEDENLLKTKIPDVIARGEGEFTMLELAYYFLLGKGNLSDIKGISFMVGEEIVRTPPREFIEDLDSLPIPNNNLLYGPLREEKAVPKIITGRGCPFNCAFCFEGITGKKYRKRSPENVLSEIKYYLERGEVKYLGFLDDTFAVDGKRLFEICKGIKQLIKEFKEFVWFAEGRVDILARNPIFLFKMTEAGLINLQIGVESGNQEILDIYQKKITLEEILKVVETANQAYTMITANFILGGPKESEETLNNSLNFARKLIRLAPGRVICTSSLLMPYPGTQIALNPSKYGLKIIDPYGFTGVNTECVATETEYLDKYQIQNWHKRFSDATIAAMIEILDEVPLDVLMEHIYLNSFRFTTTWFEIISFDPGRDRYLTLLFYEDNYTSIRKTTFSSLISYYPLRTYPLAYSENGNIVLMRVEGKLELDEKLTILLEQCDGERSVEEILNWWIVFWQMNRENAFKELDELFTKLDAKLAVVFFKL